MALHLYLFKGGHEYDGVCENYDIYVRAERKKDVLGMVLDFYEWRREHHDKDGMSDASIMATYAEGGFSIQRIKSYPEGAGVKAGVVPWDVVDALL